MDNWMKTNIPYSACPPTGEHLRELLLDDADNFSDLGHI